MAALPLTFSQLVNAFWKSLYLGGLGAELDCTTASASVAIPGASNIDLIAITNLGDSPAFIRLGASDVVATTAGYPIFVTERVFLPRFAQGTPAFTHIAGITRTGTATLLINTGNGNRAQ